MGGLEGHMTMYTAMQWCLEVVAIHTRVQKQNKPQLGDVMIFQVQIVSGDPFQTVHRIRFKFVKTTRDIATASQG
jgi:hypothetical protein